MQTFATKIKQQITDEARHILRTAAPAVSLSEQLQQLVICYEVAKFQGRTEDMARVKAEGAVIIEMLKEAR